MNNTLTSTAAAATKIQIRTREREEDVRVVRIEGKLYAQKKYYMTTTTSSAREGRAHGYTRSRSFSDTQLYAAQRSADYVKCARVHLCCSYHLFICLFLSAAERQTHNLPSEDCFNTVTDFTHLFNSSNHSQVSKNFICGCCCGCCIFEIIMVTVKINFNKHTQKDRDRERPHLHFFTIK